MGVRRGYLSRVENGHLLPSLDQHLKIATALGMTLSKFIQKTWDSILYGM